MGQIEKKVRITRLKRNILSAIAGLGIASMSIVAPNALQSLRLLGLDKKSQSRNFSYWRSIRRLEKDGMVNIKKDKDMYSVSLTERGSHYFSALSFESIKRRRWDKKWRIIIFDISERKRSFRDAVRARLQQFGFLRLQDSVWVFPYDCEDAIAMLKTELRIGRDLLYIVADAIENDAFMKDYFQVND